MATFNRSSSTRVETEAATGAGTASATAMDTELNQIADGINEKYDKDGTNPLTANLDLGGYKISNYADSDASPTGVIAESHDTDTFNPTIVLNGRTILMTDSEIDEYNCWSQQIGDMVYFNLTIKWATVGALNLEGGDSYIDISNCHGGTLYVGDSSPTYESKYAVDFPYTYGAITPDVHKDGSGNTVIWLRTDEWSPVDSSLIEARGWFKITDKSNLLPSV